MAEGFGRMQPPMPSPRRVSVYTPTRCASFPSRPYPRPARLWSNVTTRCILAALRTGAVVGEGVDAGPARHPLHHAAMVAIHEAGRWVLGHYERPGDDGNSAACNKGTGLPCRHLNYAVCRWCWYERKEPSPPPFSLLPVVM